MKEYLVVTFHTTSEAMATEKACRNQEIQGRLIPVPRSLSAGCGIAWRGQVDDERKLRELMLAQDIEWEEFTTISLP